MILSFGQSALGFLALTTTSMKRSIVLLLAGHNTSYWCDFDQVLACDWTGL